MAGKYYLIHPVLFGLFISTILAAELPNDNIVYSTTIKTVQLFKEGVDMSAPLIQLNSGERLQLSFDDLDGDIKRYKYTVIHCEADWSTSKELTPVEYIDGYREENIEQSDYSYNTTVKYTHFTAFFPTSNMRPKISGNYMMIVYSDDPSNVAFTWRFMVVENSYVGIEGNVMQGSRIEDKLTKQQVDFVIKLNGFRVADVGREVKVIVQQNGRYLVRPRFARNDELDYRYDENIVFGGGNQFRWFDIKSLLYQSERIAKIAYDTTSQVYLVDDLPRTYKQYVFEKDLNGRFFIKNEEHAQNSSIEADYAWVHFFMPWPALLSNGKFFVLGEVTRWRLDENSIMNYNFNRRGYEFKLFLKQGYYNYMIVFRENGKTAGNESLVEGAHWETENEYTIYFYFHETGTSYDRLIAATTIGAIPK
jgi:hypothetical protein